MKVLNFNNLIIEILGQSQKGQDSIIKYIFDTIGTTNKFYVEFGAYDGVQYSNTWYLKNIKNWNGLLLDCNFENPSINLFRRHLTRNNIINIFQEFNIPLNFDFLSVDIDGNDFWLLKKILEVYSPRVIMTETNVRFNPEESFVMKYNENYNWNGVDWYGASPTAFKKMCIDYLYTPVYIHLDDMFLIKNDCLTDVKTLNWNEIYPQSNVELYNTHHRNGIYQNREQAIHNFIQY